MNILTHWFGEEIIYTLGWTFFHSVWQGSLVALVLAFFLQWAPQRKAGLRYQASMLALFTVLISSVCTFIYYYHGTTLPAGTDLSAFTLSGPASLQTGAIQPAGKIGWEGLLENYHPFLVAFWLSGMVIFTLRMAGGLFYIHHLRKTSQPVTIRGSHTLHALQARLGLKKAVSIATSPISRVPLVLGHLKPLILFPVGALNQLTPDELEAIIAHELAHIRRFDYLQNLIQSFIEIIFYYHPAVWWISSVIRAERENTCDDLAVKLCGNKMAYARALVRLEEAHPHSPVLAMPLYKSKNQLFIRIKRILNQPYQKSNTMEKLFATILCIGCFMLLSMSNESPVSEEMSATDNLVDIEAGFGDEGETAFPVSCIAVSRDTIPGQSSVKTKISKYTDDEQIEVTLENGELVELIIDGKTIPEGEFDNYEARVRELIADSKSVPPPPPPPGAPAPPAPPAAPRPPGDIIPPQPPQPPAPNVWHGEQDVIIHKLEDGGKRVIRVEKRGPGKQGEVEIIVDGDALFIDGEEISMDTIIRGYGHRFNIFGDSLAFRSFPRFELDFDGDRFLFKSDSNWMGIFKDGKFGESFGWIPDENWAKEYQLEMEEWKENFLENKENWKEQLRMSEEQVRELIEQKELSELHLKEEIEHQLRDQHIQQEEKMRLRKQQIEEQARDRERLFKERERRREDMIRRNFIRPDMNFGGNSAENALIKELYRDGLIDPEKGYSIKMDHKKMRINGEKMPDVLYEKYKKIIQRYAGDDDSKIDIQLKKEVKMKF